MGNLARGVLFRMPSARLYFLSDACFQIRSKARAHLKHGLFYMNVTKFMYVIGLEPSILFIGSEYWFRLDGKQCRLKYF